MVGWWVAVVVIFCLDVGLALRTLDLQMLFLGGTLAVLCLIYLAVNHSLGGKWRPFPMKEKAIGVLFAAGTVLGVVGQLPSLTLSFAIAVVLFAVLCTFNCLSIAAWERELDVAQGKASFLTGWPAVAGALQADWLRDCPGRPRLRLLLAFRHLPALVLPGRERAPSR